jgi:hypothetical protein
MRAAFNLDIALMKLHPKTKELNLSALQANNKKLKLFIIYNPSNEAL